MPSYRVFGIVADSELPLEELESIPTEPSYDLRILRASATPARPLEADEPLIDVRHEDVVMSYPGVGVFTVNLGERTIAAAVEPGAESLVSLPLLGPVMAVYLHLRGRLVLHASAVIQDERVVSFVGDKGAGKSTTAAACVRSGARLLTDDLLSCSFPTGGGAWCEPGFAQLKLNNDASTALSPDAAEVRPAPHPLFTKQILRLPQTERDPVRLNGLCELVRGPGLAATRLAAPEALALVLRHSYVARYGSTFLSGIHASTHFRSCAALVASTPVWRLQAPDSLSELEADAPRLMTLLGKAGR